MASVVDFVVRVHMADDSDVMEMDLAHVGIDGTVIRRHVGPDGMINCTGECGMMYTSSLSTNDLGISMAGAESSDGYVSASYTR